MFDDYVIGKIKNVKSLLGEALDPKKWEFMRATVEVRFMIVEIFDRDAFVPIGTKEKPAGLSLTTDDYVLFAKDREPMFVITAEALKSYIKENAKNLKQSINDRYDTVGFTVGVRELFEYMNDEGFVLTLWQ